MKRKIICGLTALIMLLTMLGGALAGEGDRILALMSNDDHYSTGNLRQIITVGNQIYLFIQGSQQELRVIDAVSGESETYDMSALMDRMAAQPAVEAEEAGEDAAVEEMVAWFAREDGLYTIVNRTIVHGEESQVDGGHVRKLLLAEGEMELAQEDTLVLDWSGMTEQSGAYVYSKYINKCEASADRLYLSIYEEMGNEAIRVYNLQDGSCEERIIPNMNGFAVAEDGRLLISRYIWGENSEQTITLYDPETESEELLLRSNAEEGSISGVAFDQKTGNVYFVKGGELLMAPAGDAGQAIAVNDCPLTSIESFGKLLPNGQMLLWGYNAAVLRNTDPALRSQVTVRIRPFSWSMGLDSACFAFSAERSDITLVREDWGDTDTLLQGMMNRDDQVDVYLINLDDSAFNAVLERGFTLDLSGNPVLTEAAARMYPQIRDAVSKDGKLMAVPVSFSGSGLGYRTEALEKLGMTEADLPKTWNQLLDFLEALPERLKGTEVRAFEVYSWREDLQQSLVNWILTQFSITRPEASFNTEELRSLLERIRQLDYDALGVMTEEELQQAEEQGAFESRAWEMETLLSTYADYSLAVYGDGTVPLALSLAEGEAPMLPCSMTVAFVNPYSKHPQEAMAFLESMLNHLDTGTRYSFYPDLNDPVRYPNHEEGRKNLEKWVEEARLNLEKAEDEEKENWQNIVDEYTKELEDYDEKNWMLSPRQIAAYRSNAEYLTPTKWDFYRAIYNSEGGERFWDLQHGFVEGNTSAAELLNFIDQKVRLMRLEGN